MDNTIKIVNDYIKYNTNDNTKIDDKKRKTDWMKNLVAESPYTKSDAIKYNITRQWMDGSITPLVISKNRYINE